MMKYLVLVFLVIATTTGCEIPVCCDLGPPSFFAVIQTPEGEDYLTAHQGEPFDLYYDGENKKDEKASVQPHTFLRGDTTFLQGINIFSLSKNGIQTFYLKVGSNIDTLYVEVKRKSDRYKTVRFNGEPAQEIRFSNAEPYWLMLKR